MTFKPATSWGVYFKPYFDANADTWYLWEDTLRRTRRDAIRAADWLGDGEYAKMRRRGELCCRRVVIREALNDE